MSRNTINQLTEEQSRDAVAKFDAREILPLHSLSDVIRNHPGPDAPSDPLGLELLVSIFRTAGMLRGSQEVMLRKHNITGPAWRALGMLFFHQNHAMPLHSISQMLGVTRPHVTGIIDTLEQDGLVERIAHPDDRRVTLAHLTDKGIEQLKEVNPHYNALIAELFSPFSEEEEEQLLALLFRLRQHLASSNSSDHCFSDGLNS